jgi:hypothetical protein
MARLTTALIILAGFALPAAAFGQDAMEGAGEMESHAFLGDDAITFEPLEVPGFDPGIGLAVLRGNPMGEAGNYTIAALVPGRIPLSGALPSALREPDRSQRDVSDRDGDRREP